VQLNTKQKIGGVVAITAFLFFITSGFTILWVAGISSLCTRTPFLHLHCTVSPRVREPVPDVIDRLLVRWVRSGASARGLSPAISEQQGVVLP
jgi:hypothetical protein